MLEKICYLSFIFLGITWFILGIYDKTGLKNFAIIHAYNSYYEKLFSCDFCISIRISFLLLVFYIIINDFQLYYLILPLIVSGITYKINL